MKKKAVNGKAVVAKFDLATLAPEAGISVTPRSEESLMMYNKLDELTVGESYKMPFELLRIFTNARTAHKRITKKVFIFRKLDKFNIRTWRLADDTKLTTRRKITKAKK